jgi:hypothetical protein
MTKPIPTENQLDLDLFHDATRAIIQEQRKQLEALKANDVQVAGTHYKNKSIQPWDYIVDNNLGYLEGNIVKYVSRWKDKGGLDDLKKARHYLDKLIEVQDGKS